MKVWTTLKKLREAGACKDRYRHLRKSLGKDYGNNTPIDIVDILKHNGLDDVLWIPHSELNGDHIDQRYRLFAVACCQPILRLMGDQQSRDAVKAAHLYAHGELTLEKLSAAWAAALFAASDTARSAASDAARSAASDAARSSASDAAWAASRSAARSAASDAAWAAALSAAWAASRSAASDAARSAASDAAWAAARSAAWAAARSAAWSAAWSAAMEEQARSFKLIFSEEV